MIDLLKVYNHQEDMLEINQEVTINDDYYQDTEIVSLSSVNVGLFISINEQDQYEVSGGIEGTMVLKDSVSYEDVDYPFVIEFDHEIIENDVISNNSLDLLEFLWQNIVLEIPLRYTRVKDLSEINQKGYKIVEETTEKTINPFKDLASKLREE